MSGFPRSGLIFFFGTPFDPPLAGITPMTLFTSFATFSHSYYPDPNRFTTPRICCRRILCHVIDNNLSQYLPRVILHDRIAILPRPLQILTKEKPPLFPHVSNQSKVRSDSVNSHLLHRVNVYDPIYAT